MKGQEMDKNFSIMDSNKVKELREYDYLAKEEFGQQYCDVVSVQCWGDYLGEAPLLTVGITTNNRPSFLKEAILSVLNQVGFDDYEIIVLDNEGVEIENETPTSALIKQINSPKIIYFRNDRWMDWREDRIAALSRTKYICFVHDDDYLCQNHLNITMNIIKNHREIPFLAVKPKSILSSQLDLLIKNGEKIDDYEEVKCRKLPHSELIFLDKYMWLGAIIDREKYIDIGGMPAKRVYMGDSVMSCRFDRYYSKYYCSRVLYLYRISESQTSADTTNQTRALVSEYYYYCNALKHYIRVWNRLFENYCFWRIEKRVIQLNQLIGWNLTLSIDEIAGIINKKPFDVEKSFNGKLCKIIDFIWKRHMHNGFLRNRKYDIYIYRKLNCITERR